MNDTRNMTDLAPSRFGGLGDSTFAIVFNLNQSVVTSYPTIHQSLKHFRVMSVAVGTRRMDNDNLTNDFYEMLVVILTTIADQTDLLVVHSFLLFVLQGVFAVDALFPPDRRDEITPRTR